jgi:hypothetical protein
MNTHLAEAAIVMRSDCHYHLAAGADFQIPLGNPRWIYPFEEPIRLTGNRVSLRPASPVHIKIQAPSAAKCTATGRAKLTQHAN